MVGEIVIMLSNSNDFGISKKWIYKQWFQFLIDKEMMRLRRINQQKHEDERI